MKSSQEEETAKTSTTTTTRTTKENLQNDSSGRGRKFKKGNENARDLRDFTFYTRRHKYILSNSTSRFPFIGLFIYFTRLLVSSLPSIGKTNTEEEAVAAHKAKQ